jgi:hypothetical protein
MPYSSTGGFKVGVTYRLNAETRSSLLLRIPRDKATLLNTRARAMHDEFKEKDEEDEWKRKRGYEEISSDGVEMPNAVPVEPTAPPAVLGHLGDAVAPAGFRIVPPGRLPTTELDSETLSGMVVLFKWNAGLPDDKWEKGKVRRQNPSKGDRIQVPTANAVVKFGFGAVACELSRETYGKEMKWVLLESMI